MKNSADEDPTLAGFIEDDMLALLYPAKTWVDQTAWPSKTGPLSDANKTFNKTVQIKISLRSAPHVGRVVSDIGEIKFG